eukprot:gene15359-20699_t
MISKAKKYSKRISSNSTKILVGLTVDQCLIYNNNIRNDNANLVSLCFERGGKLSSTKDFMLLSTSGNDNTTGKGEKMELLVTIYKNNQSNASKSDMIYEAKYGKIIVREKVKNMFGMDTYVGIAMCDISIHELLAECDNNNMVTINNILKFNSSIDNNDVPIIKTKRNSYSNINEFTSNPFIYKNNNNNNNNNIKNIKNDVDEKMLLISRDDKCSRYKGKRKILLPMNTKKNSLKSTDQNSNNNYILLVLDISVIRLNNNKNNASDYDDCSENNDDVVSVVSNNSDMSIIGAVFDNITSSSQRKQQASMPSLMEYEDIEEELNNNNNNQDDDNNYNYCEKNDE